MIIPCRQIQFGGFLMRVRSILLCNRMPEAESWKVDILEANQAIGIVNQAIGIALRSAAFFAKAILLVEVAF